MASARDIEEKIVKLIAASENGVVPGDITKEFPDVDANTMMKVINGMLKTKIRAFKQADKSLLFRLNQGVSIPGASADENVVLEKIAAAGNKGIWINNISKALHIPTNPLNKILKSLETNKRIKTIKSVVEPKKKIYMLYDLTPDDSVTGGSFYSDQQFDTELANILNDQCYRYLDEKNKNSKANNTNPITAREESFASSNEILEFITKLGIV